jgi:hypothetical protein
VNISLLCNFDALTDNNVQGVNFCVSVVPDRPLVRVPNRTLFEYSYELGVWDSDPVHILILIEV